MEISSAENLFPRGSEWRVWDLHVHTPASFHWNGPKFTGDENKDNALVDEMIEAMNAAEPAVFAIMDYWNFDGWFKLVKRLEDDDAPTLLKTVFPGIELRIATPTKVRLNAHVIFSNKIEEQQLNDFKSALKLELISRSLSNSALKDYAIQAGDDKLKEHGVSQSVLQDDSEMALNVGCKIAELTRESYIEAIKNVPKGLAIGFMPFSTNDGLQHIDWNEHYAYTLSLFQTSPIFETRKEDLWAAFVGIKTAKNETWIENFQQALNNVPRLAVSGSDAHRFISVNAGSNDRGYGDFPSGKKTWIKANPTWEGLKQAIKEPANRSYIGQQPHKLSKVFENKTFYIDKLCVNKHEAPTGTPNWLTDCEIEFNTDLVAIIGNKGSGKSALADIIALLGQSQQNHYFSFLKKVDFVVKLANRPSFFKVS